LLHTVAPRWSTGSRKYPAAVWHLLDALKRFDSLDPQRVMEITFEVARLWKSLSWSHTATAVINKDKVLDF